MADNFYGITDTGKMRDNNEDNFIAQNILSGKYTVGCVIDGVGGYEGGEIAASLARTAILNTLKKNSGNRIDVLKKAFISANQNIFNKKQTSGQNMQMACVVTLALVDINENKFYYAHVGDTRLYLFRDNSLVKVTHDHSFVGFLEESGRINEDAAMNHPRRNEINKALGFEEEKFSEPDYIETGESPFLPGDMLLLCSDGLSDMLNSRTIAGILNSPRNLKEKCKELINAANVAGGKDNITVVLIENNKPPLQQEATRPVSVKKNEPEEEVVEENTTVVPEKIIIKHSGAAGVRFLLVLCFLLMAALAWFVYTDYFKDKNQKEVISDVPAFVRNAQVKRLSDSIKNTSSKIISLKNIFSDTQNAVINDSLLIKTDSLYINGNGITLTADSAYSGAAFIFFPECKYIVFDSLTFENFNTAFIMRNKTVHLKNVRFKNCRIPVLYAMQLPGDQNISGIIDDSVLLKPNNSLLKIDSAKNIIQVK